MRTYQRRQIRRVPTGHISLSNGSSQTPIWQQSQLVLAKLPLPTYITGPQDMNIHPAGRLTQTYVKCVNYVFGIDLPRLDENNFVKYCSSLRSALTLAILNVRCVIQYKHLHIQLKLIDVCIFHSTYRGIYLLVYYVILKQSLLTYLCIHEHCFSTHSNFSYRTRVWSSFISLYFKEFMIFNFLQI